MEYLPMQQGFCFYILSNKIIQKSQSFKGCFKNIHNLVKMYNH